MVPGEGKFYQMLRLYCQLPVPVPVYVQEKLKVHVQLQDMVLLQVQGVKIQVHPKIHGKSILLFDKGNPWVPDHHLISQRPINYFSNSHNFADVMT